MCGWHFGLPMQRYATGNEENARDLNQCWDLMQDKNSDLRRY
jgi:hypothetical protein